MSESSVEPAIDAPHFGFHGVAMQASDVPLPDYYRNSSLSTVNLLSSLSLCANVSFRPVVA